MGGLSRRDALLAAGIVVAVLAAILAGGGQRAETRDVARGLEHMGGAHHIRSVGCERLLVGEAHERLRGKMKNEVGLRSFERTAHRIVVPDVAQLMPHHAFESKLLEERRRGSRRQREAVDLGPQLLQPRCKPRTFEASMAREPDGLSAIGVSEHHQIFHGA